MIVIYSDKEIKGVGGCYCSPRLFDGIDSRATLVISNDKKIQEAYKAVGIEVKGFPRTSAPKVEVEKETE